MPFPLKSLHYDLCRRLRELASPAEAYDLQIAAPHFDGLKPLQQITILSSAKIFFNDNKQLCAESVSLSNTNNRETLELNNSVLYVVEQSLQFYRFDHHYDAKFIFDHFIVAPQEIFFQESDLTPKLLHDVSSNTKKNILFLNITICRFHDGATIELVCKLFKKLMILTVGPLVNCFEKRSWIDALTTINYSNMFSMYIYQGDINILNIDESQLIKFIEAQHHVFSLYITLKPEIDDHEVKQSLNRLFGDRFELLEKKTYPRRIITIVWTSSETRYERCYSLREDKRESELI